MNKNEKGGNKSPQTIKQVALNVFTSTHKISENTLDKVSLHTTNSLPIDGLPDWAKELIQEVERVRQCPREFPTSALFSAVSTLVGGNVKIRGKHTNTLCLWLVNVAPSGCGKSQPTKDIFEPIRRIDAELYSTFKNELREWKKTKDNPEPKPKCKQLCFSDATPEARNGILSDNPSGSTLCRDEIAGMIDDFGRYNKSGEVAQILSIFDSDTIRVNRKSDDPLLINEPYMPIYGGIQPDIIPSTFGNKKFMVDGFNARFLFCYPEEMNYPEYSDTALNESIMKLWDEVARVMYTNKPKELQLSKDAVEVYTEYFNKMQKEKERCANNGDNNNASIFAKLQIHVIRWSGIVRMMYYVQEEHKEDEVVLISGDNMQFAVRCMDYFAITAKRVLERCNGSGNPLSLIPNHNILAEIKHRGLIKNITQFAESIGMARETISRY